MKREERLTKQVEKGAMVNGHPGLRSARNTLSGNIATDRLPRSSPTL